MADLDSITRLREAQEENRQQLAKFKAVGEHAAEQYRDAMTKLKELGYDDPEEALKAAQKTRDELSGTVNEIITKLKEAAAQ